MVLAMVHLITRISHVIITLHILPHVGLMVPPKEANEELWDKLLGPAASTQSPFKDLVYIYHIPT